MQTLPHRGPGVRRLGLAIPPEPMPLFRRGRPLKRWRYVGVFGPELMLCAARARVGPMTQGWWAVAEPGRPLVGRTAFGGGGVSFEGARVLAGRGDVRIDLTLEEGEGVESVSQSGRDGYIWTRKQAGVSARGSCGRCASSRCPRTGGS